MADPALATEVVRLYRADLRATMGALLKARPRYVRLVSGNARSVRCVFSTEANGFRLGQPVTADLTSMPDGTRVCISSGGEVLHPRVQQSLEQFLDEVERSIRSAGDVSRGCGNLT